VAPERATNIGLGPTIEAPGDGAAFRRRYGLTGPLVLFVGRKERYKGIHAIVAAAPAVWAQHPRAQFAFVGEPSALNFLTDPFRGHRDPRLVDLPGLDEAEKPDAFAACDVFCLPSVHETFGLVFAEAWLCAKPVIGGDIPALREVITDGRDGFVVRQRPEAIANAINRLLGDAELRHNLGEAGREKVRSRYNWERTVSEHEALYATIYGRERRTSLSLS
jgi:glycosyltransferase involved in cell wall biosynthesis